MKTTVDKFLKELRDSADIQYKIFTEGSCVRLYMILKTIFPKAVAYWSDVDGHCVTKIGEEFYDIGGVLRKDYIIDKSYFKIPARQLRGYSLLKWINKDENLSIVTQKYKN